MTSKILCATDGTQHSAHAVELAAAMAAKLGASLSICAVNVAHGGVRGPLIYTWEDDEVKKILDGAAATARRQARARSRNWPFGAAKPQRPSFSMRRKTASTTSWSAPATSVACRA